VSAPFYGDAAPLRYPALLAAAFAEAGDVREEAYRADQRLKIWGPQEARGQSAETVILGGLNEGVWPMAPAVDPWLSRPMRARAGLPLPERRIGLSAHDFLQAVSAPRAVMTRSLKEEGVPKTRARWLARLLTLLEGVDQGAAVADIRARGQHWLSLADAMGLAPKPLPFPRPEPQPPASARPRKLWVTDIEKLIRDPYSVYARRILNLRPLDDPGALPDARLRGQVLHAAVERFVSETKAGVPAGREADDLYIRIAEEEVDKAAASASLGAAWSARLDRVKDWFLSEERKRRAYSMPFGVEVEGEMTFPTAAGPFVLAGRADRIDRLRDGGVAIYDYKAGKAPTKKQIGIFAKQLPLLASIAEAGGFDGFNAEQADYLAYLSLSGAGEGGKAVEVAIEADGTGNLTRRIESFEDEARTYIPRAYPHEMAYDSVQDSLSRYGEWTDRPATEGPL